MSPCTETIAAPATPTGTAALAVVRVSGPDTARLAGEIFGRTPPPRVARHADYRDLGGAVIDDVVALFFQGPRSYTGEDSLEISCHGNPFIVQRILGDLLARGCRSAEPGEFTRRAFLNGRMDLSQAEAVVDVIHARSERALDAANQQLRGALGRRIEAAVQRLLGILAHVEAYIDFPDEDLPAEDQRRLGREIADLLRDINRLRATSRYGEVLRDGIRTVILGAPNVGKSSLLNRFLGRDRALVSPVPGTTRDFLEEPAILGPHCFRLVDTAGLNPEPAELEQLGIEKTWESAAEGDLFIFVVDATDPSPALPGELERLVTEKRGVVVLNKVDAPGARAQAEIFGRDCIGVSALTGEGWESLTARLIKLAEELQPQNSESEIAIGARHAAALAQAAEGLTAAQVRLENGGATELLASDLRAALAAFGEIAGKVDNERMLDALFASFCIGK